jgi:hypothetical protein
MNRLQSIAPDVADAVTRAPSHKRRAAAIAAASQAVKISQLESSVAMQALDVLGAGGQLADSINDQLKALLTQLDDEYFNLQDEGKEQASLERFGKARAVASVLYAAGADAAESASESIYEATATIDDPAAVLQVVRASLSS